LEAAHGVRRAVGPGDEEVEALDRLVGGGQHRALQLERGVDDGRQVLGASKSCFRFAWPRFRFDGSAMRPLADQSASIDPQQVAHPRADHHVRSMRQRSTGEASA
jgi:hypothetical protein